MNVLENNDLRTLSTGMALTTASSLRPALVQLPLSTSTAQAQMT